MIQKWKGCKLYTNCYLLSLPSNRILNNIVDTRIFYRYLPNTMKAILQEIMGFLFSRIDPISADAVAFGCRPDDSDLWILLTACFLFAVLIPLGLASYGKKSRILRSLIILIFLAICCLWGTWRIRPQLKHKIRVAQCESQDGTWLPGVCGYVCNGKTTDVGKICNDESECQGYCVADSECIKGSECAGKCSIGTFTRYHCRGSLKPEGSGFAIKNGKTVQACIIWYN